MLLLWTAAMPTAAATAAAWLRHIDDALAHLRVSEIEGGKLIGPVIGQSSGPRRGLGRDRKGPAGRFRRDGERGLRARGPRVVDVLWRGGAGEWGCGGGPDAERSGGHFLFNRRL
mgnify:CR=1 FL=1